MAWMDCNLDGGGKRDSDRISWTAGTPSLNRIQLRHHNASGFGNVSAAAHGDAVSSQFGSCMTARRQRLTGRILIVDDQPANLHVVSTLLARHGYEVTTAANGEVALEMLQTQPPDLVLLDMLMPGMDGFELMAEIRRQPELAQLPVVFLTVAQDRDLLLRAFETGAVDYVTKPFMPEELLARVEAHLGLKRMRDRLERVARERQELVNLVAHDLKNPLTSVHFAIDILLAGGVSDERRARYFRMIRESTDDAFGYIRRYLETQAASVSTPQAGDDAAVASVGELLQWLEGRYALQLEAQGSRLRLPDLPDPPRIRIDPVVLRQVCENMISNALKYAPGSDLDISVCSGGPGFWQIHFEDRGPGIPASQREALFTPFFRIEGSRDDGVSSGLGLSLARQIVGNLGGELWYEDRDGGGARFVISLPQAPGS
ncbi:hybrid sensor histidine kinase/response regulator [Luteimonas aestuarii]|uniref:histidine kinase n=2 Tax=Luteimonas aestuarii TaxID=453837 RepID=A0A4R5TRK6_9GAMM|nr:hybrid sensor histidine kinase/response regulator [Luteimonas aestuarii]